MNTVPFACIRRRNRTIGFGLSSAARRVRSANGSRIEGRNRLTARTMWVARRSGNQAGMPADCRARPLSGRFRLLRVRTASSATQSPSADRSPTASPTAANASRTSASRST